MQANRFYMFSLIILVLLMGFLSFQVMRPFLQPIAWAVVLSIIFYPLYAALRKSVRFKSVASIITLGIILIIILGPFSYLSFLLVSELRAVAGYIESGEIESLKDVLEYPKVAWLAEWMGSVLNITHENMQELLVQNLSKVGTQLIGKVTTGVGNVLSALLNFILMSLSLFFLLRDGPDFIKRLRNYMPFSEEQKSRLENQVKDMVVSTIFGGVVVAVVQGLIGGTAFYFLGIKSPVIWGIAIAIMSFVPIMGTFSIWGPAVVYLFIEGFTGKGLILLLIGTFGISLVDNILKPIIIGGRTKMPTLLIFFSVLGGMKLFGLIGLIMGPLVLALFISFLEIFRNIEGGDNA
ncbi:MAG: AI-2E family transporter [Thermodesulfovibrionales bacterium]|nr:AI-2E family transporter [Thermodesulfovibrionales bacterium]